MEIVLYFFNKTKDFITSKKIKDSRKFIVLFSVFFVCFLLNDCIGITRYLTNDLEFDQIERITDLKKEYKESDEAYKYLLDKEKSITTHTPLVDFFISKVREIFENTGTDTLPSVLYVIVITIPFLLIAVFFIVSIVTVLFYYKADIWTRLASCIIGCLVIVADFFLWSYIKNAFYSINICIWAKFLLILSIEILICVGINYIFKRNRKKLNENRTR